MANIFSITSDPVIIPAVIGPIIVIIGINAFRTECLAITEKEPRPFDLANTIKSDPRTSTISVLIKRDIWARVPVASAIAGSTWYMGPFDYATGNQPRQMADPTYHTTPGKQDAQDR